MFKHRKKAKKYLSDATLTDFWSVVREAKIPVGEQHILDDRFIQGKSIVRIALEQGLSVETVNRIIKDSYDKVYRLLWQD